MAKFQPRGHYHNSDEFKACCAQLKEISDGQGQSMGRVTLTAELMEAYVELCSAASVEPDFEDMGGKAGNVSCPQLRLVLGEPDAPVEPKESEDSESDSPVAGSNAADAKDHISRMTSVDKLQSIVDHDTRSSVRDAASKRLTELQG